MSDGAGTVGICTATLAADPITAGDGEMRAAGEAAVAAGFTEASTWVQHLDALAGVGLRIACVEAAMTWANADRATAEAESARLVATAERVGAGRIVAVCLEPELADMAGARANLAVLVAQAREAGAQVCVEFLPWTGIPDLATAWALVEPLGPGAGLVLDTWHWVRQPGGPAPGLLDRIPGDRIGLVQLADAAAEPEADVFGEAMTNRLLPGEGVVDFAGLLARLDAAGADPLVTTEVFAPGLVRDRGPLGAATAMRDAATRLPGLRRSA